MAIDSLVARHVEYMASAKTKNKGQPGVYVIPLAGVFEYGFSQRNSYDEAIAELKSKGYSGPVISFKHSLPGEDTDSTPRREATYFL